MTTYYIDPVNGSNSNNGLGPDASHASNKPFLTIGKILATSGVGVSGDVVYLAPGTYREVVTVNITSPVSELQILADPANAQGFKTSSGVRVAAGPVIWTAYTTNDITAPSSSAPLILNGRDYITLEGVIMHGGSGTTRNVIDTDTAHSRNITLRRLALYPGNGNSNALVRYTGTAGESADWVIDSCIFAGPSIGAIRIDLPTSASADYDSNFLIKNCMLCGVADNAILITGSGANSFKGGGVDIHNCYIQGRGGVSVNNANISTSIPCTIYNSIVPVGQGACLSANTSGQLLENYNVLTGATVRTNVTAGGNSISNNSYALMLSWGHEWLNSGMQVRPAGAPMSGSPMLGFGSDGAVSLTTDIMNRARPAGGASTSKAIGAFERHDTAAKETSVVDAGSNAVKITGPGDHDLFIPVDASSTTITVRMRYDTNHATTNKPQATILNGEEIGVTTETKTMTAGIDTWETLTFSSFTPTAKGIITLRLISRSAAGNGIAYFDTVTGGANGSQGLDYFRRSEPLQAAVASAAAGGGPVFGGMVVR